MNKLIIQINTAPVIASNQPTCTEPSVHNTPVNKTMARGISSRRCNCPAIKAVTIAFQISVLDQDEVEISAKLLINRSDLSVVPKPINHANTKVCSKGSFNNSNRLA